MFHYIAIICVMNINQTVLNTNVEFITSSVYGKWEIFFCYPRCAFMSWDNVLFNLRFYFSSMDARWSPESSIHICNQDSHYVNYLYAHNDHNMCTTHQSLNGGYICICISTKHGLWHFFAVLVIISIIGIAILISLAIVAIAIAYLKR